MIEKKAKDLLALRGGLYGAAKGIKSMLPFFKKDALSEIPYAKRLFTAISTASKAAANPEHADDIADAFRTVANINKVIKSDKNLQKINKIIGRYANESAKKTGDLVLNKRKIPKIKKEIEKMVYQTAKKSMDKAFPSKLNWNMLIPALAGTAAGIGGSIMSSKIKTENKIDDFFSKESSIKKRKKRLTNAILNNTIDEYFEKEAAIPFRRMGKGIADFATKLFRPDYYKATKAFRAGSLTDNLVDAYRLGNYKKISGAVDQGHNFLKNLTKSSKYELFRPEQLAHTMNLTKRLTPQELKWLKRAGIGIGGGAGGVGLMKLTEDDNQRKTNIFT